MSEPETIYVEKKPKTGCLTQGVAAFFILVLILFIMSLVSDSKPPSTGSRAERSGPIEADVEVSEVKGRRLEYDGLEISGIVRNKRGAPLDRLLVRFSIFDAAGNKIEEAGDYISDLDAGGTWKFKASVFKSDATRFQIEGVWCNKGELLVKYLDQERREQRERAGAIEKEEKRKGAQAARELAVENERARKQESARQTFEFYSQRATNGDGFAQLRLGQLYLTGQGIEWEGTVWRLATNLEMARFWLFCAATNGRQDAAEILKSMPTGR